MPRKKAPLDVFNQGEQLNSQLKREPSGWRRERLQAVSLGLAGELELEEIGDAIGRSRATIQNWFNLYRKGGIELLLTKKKGNGPESKLTGKAAEEFREKLAEGEWRTAEQAREWLEKEHGLIYKPGSVYKLLGKHGGRLKVPRPVHRKKNLEAAEAFKTDLEKQLHDLDVDRSMPVRIWVQDEMRYGLQPVTRRAWGLPGIRIVKTTETRYQWGYVYGSIEVNGDGAEFTFMPSVNKDITRIHLEQVANSDPDSVHIIIWDGAGFHHHDKDPELPENVRLLRLPAYSPELNPIEKLWDIVKDEICNTLYETLADLEDALTKPLRKYWENPAKIRSLIGEGWMLDQVNASSKIYITKITG